jgi:hypothetical protein
MSVKQKAAEQSLVGVATRRNANQKEREKRQSS